MVGEMSRADDGGPGEAAQVGLCPPAMREWIPEPEIQT